MSAGCCLPTYIQITQAGWPIFQKRNIGVGSEYTAAKGTKGMFRGYPSNRWPRWFNPTLIDMKPEPVSSFPDSYPVTRAGDVRFVPTPGHTIGHLSVIVTTSDITYFLAGDASYTQALMLSEKIDGVSLNRVNSAADVGTCPCIFPGHACRIFAQSRP